MNARSTLAWQPGTRALENARPVSRLAPIHDLFGREEMDAAPAATDAGRTITYERGSMVSATDGPVGTLRQVVVDEATAEVKALIVRMAAKPESVLVPPDLVERASEGVLQLNVTREQFARGASRSPRFEPRMFTAADPGFISRVIPQVFRGDARRSVVRILRDRVETGEEPAESPMPAPDGRRGWMRRFSRR